MSNESDIPLFPIVGWNIGPIPTHGVVAFQPYFIASPMDPVEAAQPSRYYAMTPAQARELAQKILEAADTAESFAAQVPPDQQN